MPVLKGLTQKGKTAQADLRHTDGQRLRVLLSAYACCPNHGSEPEVGWSFACAMAKHHDVWVLTRASNSRRIQAEWARRPVPGLNFIYYDLPALGSRTIGGGIFLQLYYYIWQLAAVRTARRKQAEIGFDIAHHVTFAKYWAPSCLAWLNIPYIFGPVGGAEHTPATLLSALGFSGRITDLIKRAASRVGERDFVVKRTVRRAALVFASTTATAQRLTRMGAGTVRVETQIGIDSVEAPASESGSKTCRFVSIGRMVHWKGFFIGLKAFAKSGLKECEYRCIGDGPCRGALEKFAEAAGLSDRVCFLGNISREEVLRELSRADVLVHPSFHDSAGLVCLEAMAAGRPVICLNTGGPGGLVDETSGIRVSVEVSFESIVDGMSAAMLKLAADNNLRQSMGNAARMRAFDRFSWSVKAAKMSRCYFEILSQEVSE